MTRIPQLSMRRHLPRKALKGQGFASHKRSISDARRCTAEGDEEIIEIFQKSIDSGTAQDPGLRCVKQLIFSADRRGWNQGFWYSRIQSGHRVRFGCYFGVCMRPRNQMIIDSEISQFGGMIATR